jgi:hypothetical protein
MIIIIIILSGTAAQRWLWPHRSRGFLITHTTRHSRYDSSGRVISSSQRPLPDNTQHAQQTNIHARGGIRTHDCSRRAAVDPRLRSRGHWDWQQRAHRYTKYSSTFKMCHNYSTA